LPAISGVSHISFSVSNAEASAKWWTTLLGLTEIDRVSGDTWRGIVMLHPPTRTILEVQQHDGNTGDLFDPRRTGLDHMGFKVDTYGALEEWLARFARLGVTHSPIADRDYGAVLTFKDPDGIQFEIFYKSDHP
jgi:glyoxylase I family protein